MEEHDKFGVSYLLQIQKYSKIQPIQSGLFWPPNVLTSSNKNFIQSASITIDTYM